MKAMPLTICPMNDCMRYESNQMDGMCIHAIDDEVTLDPVPGPSCPWPQIPHVEIGEGTVRCDFLPTYAMSFVIDLWRKTGCRNKARRAK